MVYDIYHNVTAVNCVNFSRFLLCCYVCCYLLYTVVTLIAYYSDLIMFTM